MWMTRLVRLSLALVLAVCGICLAIDGVGLLSLGGSPYYLCAGIVLVGIALLVVLSSEWSLALMGALVAATLAWAVWEVGLDWWQLAPRGGVLVVLATVMILPPVRRSITGGHTAPASARVALAASLVLCMAVAVLSLLVNPQRHEGTLPGEPGPALQPSSGPATAGDDWPAYGGTQAGQHWSSLDQIDRDNVDRLEVAWTYRTGYLQPDDMPNPMAYEVTPIKLGGRLYLCTPNGIAIALDAESGREVWRRDVGVRIDPGAQLVICRGVSYWSAQDGEEAAGNALCRDRIFMPTVDARLFALDAATGLPCRDFGEAGAVDLSRGMKHAGGGLYYATSPPVIAGRLVILGGQVKDNQSTTEPSGVLRAFDAVTGELVWNWDAGRPDDTSPLGAGETYTPNSPNSWTISSYNSALGLVYVPLGNPTPDQYGGQRSADDERFGTSLVALDASTGAVRWVFQTVHHDLWDMDNGSQPVLVDLDLPAGRVPALVLPTKTGNLFVLDRRTGKPVLPVTERSVPQGAVAGDFTAPTQPFSAINLLGEPETEARMWGATMFGQLECRIAFRRLRYEGHFTPPSEQGTLAHPGSLGVFNWSGIAVDPQRQIAFAAPNYMAYTLRMIPRAEFDRRAASGPGGVDYGDGPNIGLPYAVGIMPFLASSGLPCQAPPWGRVAGIDLRTGKTAWLRPNGTVRDLAPLPLPFAMGVPTLGGPIATAGGVAFMSGSLDYFLRAYDMTSGKQLWRSRLPAGGQATPMTYRSAQSGRQFVVVVAGGYQALGTRPGDYVIAYALPDSVREASD